jgi:uncharacterized membrane protein (UPF0127 family)
MFPSKLQTRNWFNFCGYLLGAGLVAAFSVQAIAHYQANQPQQLPTTAQLRVNNSVVALEVATTPRQRALGLMHRSTLPADRGMLFPVNPPQPIQTWMRDVQFDLDVLFLRDGRIQAIAFATPCTLKDCPCYHSHTAVDQVIELAGGQVAALGLKVGDRVSIQPISTPDHETNSP